MKSFWEKIGLSRIFLEMLTCFIAGVFFAELLPYLKNIFWPLAFLIIVSMLWRKEKLVLILALGAMSFLIGAKIFQTNLEKISVVLPKEGSKEIIGIIDDFPEQKEKYTWFVIKDSEGIRYFWRDYKKRNFAYGDELEFEAEVKKIEPFNGFAYDRYLYSRDVFGELKPKGKIEVTAKGKASKFFQILYALKGKIVARIDANLHEPYAALAKGILLGIKDFSSEEQDNFRRTGTSHIVAVSGFNMMLVVQFIVIVTRFFPLAAFYLTVFGGIIIFTLITGAEASVIRAAIMASLPLIARILGRKNYTLNALIFTAAVMISFNPLILRYDLGFQLSFLAFIGITYVSAFLAKLKFFSRLPEILKINFIPSFGAEIATLPIIISTFGYFSAVAPITNFLIVPLVGPATIWGFVSVFASAIFEPLGRLFFYLDWLLLKLIFIIIDFFAAIKWSVLTVPKWNWILVAIYFLVLGVLMARKNYAKK